MAIISYSAVEQKKKIEDIIPEEMEKYKKDKKGRLVKVGGGQTEVFGEYL